MWPFSRPAAQRPEEQRSSLFSTDIPTGGVPKGATLAAAVHALSMPRTVKDFTVVTGAEGMSAMDSSNFENSIKAAGSLSSSHGIPDGQLYWFASQGFIGYQLCAIIAQHWLVNKACAMPGRDAVRTGFEIKIGGGLEVGPNVIDAIKAADKKYRLRRNLVEFVKFGRVFGIRIAMFVVDSTDPDYYKNPFNPDGITPGSYRGINQIDPYWCSPQLSTEAAANPLSIDFYEPTYWLVNGKMVHKSHLVIMRGEEVADVLKPSYQYGGMSLPQRIYERVYAAERTANEAPMLALSKRVRTLSTNMAKVIANPERLLAMLTDRSERMNNFGTDVIDLKEDKVEHSDTTLADFDAVMMSQYQVVAAIANTPATKLLGTTPKGFNSSGDYEEASYHEELETLQEHDLSPLIDRHHLCVWRSDIAPKFAGLKPDTRVEHVWNPTDSLTAKEQAEVNKLKAETGKTLMESGAIDGIDERDRITNDKDSGYSGLPALAQEPDDDGDPTTRNPLTLPTVPAVAPPAATLDGVAMDASLWDAIGAQLDGAELVSNQDFIDPAIVAAKMVAQDFRVQVTPAFRDGGSGKLLRVIIDGHHSLQAAIMSGVTPQFEEANYQGSEYRNAATLVPV